MRLVPLASLSLLVIPLTLAAACGSSSSAGGGDAGPPGDGGCIEQTPTQGAPCSQGQVLCNPGNICCEGAWSCDPNTGTWNLLHGGCACEVDANVPDTGSDATPQDAGQGDAAGSFSCGTLSCDAATQYCLVSHSPIPVDGGGTSYACDVPDGGGAPSCGGMPTATMPGDCGCYQSPSGAVTIGFCPP